VQRICGHKSEANARKKCTAHTARWWPTVGNNNHIQGTTTERTTKPTTKPTTQRATYHVPCPLSTPTSMCLVSCVSVWLSASWPRQVSFVKGNQITGAHWCSHTRALREKVDKIDTRIILLKIHSQIVKLGRKSFLNLIYDNWKATSEYWISTYNLLLYFKRTNFI